MAGDVVFVEGLEVRAILGVNDEEREEAQTVVVDLEIATDARTAARRDDLADAVNYRTIAKDVLAFASKSRFFLVETFAERLAERLMAERGLPWLRLRVAKPGAVRFSRSVGVVIERGTRPGA
jgi:dihydroneopterin aldolase